MYQLASGAGYDGDGNDSTLDSGEIGTDSSQLQNGFSMDGDVPQIPSFTENGQFDDTGEYADVLDPVGRIGAAGFRDGALPVVFVFTDTGTKYRIPDVPIVPTEIRGLGAC